MITGDLAVEAQQLLANREPFVHATVVRAVHPTSVRPGDCALVRTDGTIRGFVGGHCAQASVRLHAARVLETGEAVLLRIAPDPAAGGDAEEGVVFAHNSCLSGGALDVFLDPQLPAPRMVIGGETPIAQALADIASAAGYTVARAPAHAVAPQASDTAVVVASHGEDEAVALTRALEAGVPYIGLVASAHRGAAILASLDVDDALHARVRTPTGLDIAARTPVDVAIAILAQIVAERTSMPPVAVSPARATAIDPVCGMEVVANASSIHADLEGERVYFCCEGCHERYLERVAGDVAAS